MSRSYTSLLQSASMACSGTALALPFLSQMVSIVITAPLYCLQAPFRAFPRNCQRFQVSAL
jgi:hypothetical protein